MVFCHLQMVSSREQILKSTQGGLVSLISSATFGKFLNFGANIFIMRSVGRRVLGTGIIRLEDILYLGPLILTRESLRIVAYRISDSDEDTRQSLINVAWLSVPITLCIAMILVVIMILNPPLGIAAGSYNHAVLYTLLAVFCTALAEPAFVLAQSQLLVNLRASIELAAILGKCATMLGLIMFTNMEIEAFAIANVTYSCIHLCGYWSQVSFIWPKRLVNTGHWCTKHINDSVRLFGWQVIQKWLLQNGEKIILLFLGTNTQQGVYVVVERLGGVVVRMLFKPIEEMSLATFGKLTILEHDGQKLTKTIYSIFSRWLLLLTLIGLTFLCLGSGFTHFLLHFMYGTVWSATGAPYTLAWYCVYVFFMSVNGICEAFVQGTSSNIGIQQYNRWMLVFSIIYIIAIYLFVPLFGTSGIIFANIVKMACRITVCVNSYIFPYFQKRMEFTLPRPHLNVLLLFASALIFTQCSSIYVYTTERPYLHVFSGIVWFVVIMSAVWKYHRVQLMNHLKVDNKNS